MGDTTTKPNPFDAAFEGTEKGLNGGAQWRFTFDNGFGASVVRSDMSYGGPAGLWELAVFGQDGHLNYDTPITDDVLGWLTEAAVADILRSIAALPVPK